MPRGLVGAISFLFTLSDMKQSLADDKIVYGYLVAYLGSLSAIFNGVESCTAK